MGFFNLFKKEEIQTLAKLKVDMHSHILPALDDGSSNLVDSQILVERLIEHGYEKLIATPHIMFNFYDNSKDTILPALEKLRLKCKELNHKIEIEAAAEYYLDEGLINKLSNNEDLLCFGPNKYVLFETSYMNESSIYNQAVFMMKSNGYSPVLAHPERYIYAYPDFKIYEKMFERGALFQININSLSGYYSEGAKVMAEKLIDRKMVHFAGTDCHKIKHIETLSKSLKSKHFNKLLDLPLLNRTL